MDIKNFNHHCPRLQTILEDYPTINEIVCGFYTNSDGDKTIQLFRINGTSWKMYKKTDDSDKALLIELGLKEDEVNKLVDKLHEEPELIWQSEMRLGPLTQYIVNISSQGNVTYR